MNARIYLIKKIYSIVVHQHLQMKFIMKVLYQRKSINWNQLNFSRSRRKYSMHIMVLYDNKDAQQLQEEIKNQNDTSIQCSIRLQQFSTHNSI